MSNMDDRGYWIQDPYVRACLVWRSITLTSEFSGAPDEAWDYMQCTDSGDPEQMADRAWVLYSETYVDRGVVRRLCPEAGEQRGWGP